MKRFTEPTIAHDKTNGWYVWFKFLDEKKGKWETVRSTGNANRKSLSPSERKSKLEAEQKLWKYKLEVQHYNPLTKQFEPPQSEIITTDVSRLQVMNFAQAMEYAYNLKKPTWSSKSAADYKSVKKYLVQSATALNINSMLIGDIRKIHYKAILMNVKQARKLQASGYNKYKDYLSSLVGELAEWEIIDANYAEKIKYQSEIKKFAHKPPTERERIKISNCLKTKHRNFYRFCSTLFATTIREKELLALQLKDLDFIEQKITIIPDQAADNSKVKNERESVIPNTLLKLLSEVHVYNMPEDYYLFSKNYLPGPTRLHSNTPTANWRAIVKEGLGIQKDLYGLKKLGGDIMIEIQAEVKKLLELPKKQMGHTTNQMTEVYVTKHIEIMKELFKSRMPEL